MGLDGSAFWTAALRKPFQFVFAGCGMSRAGAAGLWAALACSGRLWEALGSVLDCSGRVWEALEGLCVGPARALGSIGRALPLLLKLAGGAGCYFHWWEHDFLDFENIAFQ